MSRNPSRALAALALLTAVQPLPGIAPDQWVPARWHGGPLEVHRIRQSGTKVDPETAQMLAGWYRPETLDLLKDTPINCLLVTWSAGADSALESEQHRLVAVYAREAHARGIAVLGVAYAGSDPEKLIAGAPEAKLDGIVLDGNLPADFAVKLTRIRQPGAQSLPVIPMSAGLWLASPDCMPVLGASDGVTARARVAAEADTVTATPTSEPWIDYNTWLVRSLRARDGRPVWLGHRLEKPSTEDYERNIADAAAAGGRWVLAPDASLMAGLARKRPEALAVWRRISDCLKFFEEHGEWRRFEPAGPLGIVQDSGSKYSDVSAETLNLINRRRIPYRLIERPLLTASAVDGLKAVLATDLAPPTAGERNLLAAFAEHGGLLVAGPSWGAAPSGGAEYEERTAGEGRVVVYKSDPPDPEGLSKHMLSLLGRGNLGIRLFNASSVLSTVSSSDAGRRLLVQLINYASLPSEAVTVRIGGDYRAAKLYAPGSPPVVVPLEKSANGVQAGVRTIPVYAALMLEK